MWTLIALATAFVGFARFSTAASSWKDDEAMCACAYALFRPFAHLLGRTAATQESSVRTRKPTGRAQGGGIGADLHVRQVEFPQQPFVAPTCLKPWHPCRHTTLILKKRHNCETAGQPRVNAKRGVACGLATI